MSKELFREELRRAIKLKEVDDAAYNQQVLARASGVSNTHISAILRGVRGASAETIQQLALALGKTPSEAQHWIILNSLLPESPSAPKSEEFSGLLVQPDGGIGAIRDVLRELVKLTERQVQLLETIAGQHPSEK